MNTTLDMTHEAYRTLPEQEPTTLANYGYDGCWGASGTLEEVVEVDRIAANPINGRDPSGLATIADVDKANWEYSLGSDPTHTHKIPDDFKHLWEPIIDPKTGKQVVDPQGNLSWKKDAGPHWHSTDGRKYFPSKNLIRDKNGCWHVPNKKFQTEFTTKARVAIKNPKTLKAAGFAVLSLLAVISLVYAEASGENARLVAEIKSDFGKMLASNDDYTQNMSALMIADNMSKLTQTNYTAEIVIDILLLKDKE